MGMRPNTAERRGPKTAKAFGAAELLSQEMQYEGRQEMEVEKGSPPSRTPFLDAVVGAVGLTRS